MKRTILSIIIMLLTVVGASAQSMIARGEVGTCIWYITSDGELVIAPQAGTTMGDLPEDGWNDVDGTPWMPYAENITSARFEPGVDAISLDCMFYNLYNLKDVDFTNFDTKNVMKMSKTFSGCSSLEYLDLSKLNTENVRWMYRMIHNCSNLKTLNLTNFQTQNAYDLDELFQNCDSLFTIISDNEEPSLLRYNTFNYFGNCSKATLKVPYGSRMKYMQSDGWRSLGNISDGTEPTFPADVLAKGEVNTCLWYITADSTLVIAPTDGVSGDLPADGWGGTGYNRVYAPWSDYGGTVKAIVVEDGVNAISCRYMFMEMFAAESADLRGLNTENATDLSYMFLKSNNLKTIDISSLKTDNVEYMESMFDGCYQLESIDVSGFNTKNVVSMNGMFWGCESLTTLDLSSFDVSNVTDMNNMFYYCLNLKTLDITNFAVSEETATGWLFSNCDSLSTIISKSKTPTALKSGFFESYDNRANCTLLVPTGSKDLYAAADGWNELGNIEEKDFPTDDEDTPGAPLLVKHLELINEYRYGKCFISKYQQEEPSEYNRSNVFSLASYYDAAPLSPVLDNYKNDSSMKENQVFYLEGGKVYYLDGSTEIFKGFTLATDPSDIAKGLRAKVICGIGLNSNAFNSYRQSGGNYYMFMLGRQITDDENEVLHMKKIAFHDIDFDNPEALNYGDNQAGEGDIAANFFINMYSDGVHQIIDSLVIDNCTFKRFVRGFIREQGACHKIWNHVLMSNNLFYDCGYYNSAAGGYPMIAGSGSNNKSNIFKDIKIIDNTFYDSPFPSLLSLATDDMEWENGAWNITFENNTLINFNTRAKGVIFSLRCLPDGSVFNVKNNLFVLTKQDGDVRQLGFWGADIRNTMTMEDGTWGVVTLNFSNNWSTNDNLTNGSIFSGSPWSSTSNNFGKLVRDEMAVLNGTLDVKVADISSTDLFTSPCPPHVALTSTDQNMHRTDALDGSASTKYNVDLYYKNFNNDIVRNKVGASRWNTAHTSVDNYIADIIYQGEVNTCKWTIDNQGTLVIAPKDGVSGDLPEYSWSYDYPAPWYEHRDTIKAARIESGVNATYCNRMFGFLSKMETINLSDFNTEKVTDMSEMFENCSSLLSLDLNSFNTQNVTDMSDMFDGCRDLTSLDLSKFDTQNVTDMRHMFAYCSSLTSLGLNSFDTQNAKYMNGMFRNCVVLTSLDLSSFNTQNVTYMAYMFRDCYALTSLDLSNFNTQNVTSMNTMFSGCSSLTSLNLTKFDTQKVMDMKNMFYGCSSLTSLDLSSFDIHNVEYLSGNDESTDSLYVIGGIEKMFYGCSSLKSLNLSNFTTENVEVMDSVFYNCDSLKYIISNVDEPSSLKVGTFDSFDNRANCTLLVPAGTKELYAEADGWNELGIIEEMEDPNRTLFGPLWASVSEDENIGVHDLELLQLAYPENKAGKEGYENYEMGNLNWDAVATLIDSEGTKIEEAYAHEVDSIGAVEFSSKLKRGEEYTVKVPKGLYLIYNMEDYTTMESPAETLTYVTDYILGDVNGDKQHSVTDVVGLASYILKGSDEVGMLVVDINGDEEATVTDITMLVDKIMTGMFPWEAEMARPRSFTTPIQAPRLFLDNKDNALALSFDNSNEFCSMQFDVTLTDADGNDITSAKSIKVRVGDGTQGHSVTTGIVDGKLRVLVYSLGNKSFKAGDVVSISVDGYDTYTASITNTELTTTSFAAVRPEGVEANVSIANGINEISSSANAQVYDLTGRKLNATTKQGVVIVGGKKVSTVQIGK